MVVTLHVPGRLILAGGFAIAMAICPTAAVLAEISSPGVSVTVADPNPNCTVKQSNASYSAACMPNIISNSGNLPSEQGLTLQNQTRR